jgi:serine/threonine protein kinase/WD40 repeat protein/tetratricopeptide (TPR) repeat protein
VREIDANGALSYERIETMNEQSLFIAVLERDPSERRAFLDSACAGNVGLRGRVEKLLLAHENAANFMERPAAAQVATVDEPITERPGTLIGPYKLLEQIGEGGMGLVFVAEQQQPIRRKVALKLIKPGMDTRQVIARFEAERQALALMDHPNIAKVYDAGTTSEVRGSLSSDLCPLTSGAGAGRPYFVMELVRGVAITEYCDANRLSLRERLELFVPVCQAVQHAHQKGIIHRDLKPSNVMVTLHDGVPVVKVIDFGVAKAIGQQLTDKSIYTRFTQMIGTPLYMSPEQAEMSGLDVDTRSDIYSLGVLLYELLTGTTPFDKERLQTVGYDEMRRIIREEEPPKPSTRISNLSRVRHAQRGRTTPSQDERCVGAALDAPYASLATISALRQTEPTKLTKMIRGELDWIVMKALEKDRNRRYETANGLARDIQRYLNDEPVQACPPSVGYRLRKLVRRYRAAALTTAALAGLLVAGTAVSTWQAVRATRATAVAERERQDAQDRLWESLRDRARAMRMSRHVGQRLEALRSIKEAMQLPLPPEHSLAELRTEAVAALALADFEVIREWDIPAGIVGQDFDDNLERYARLDKNGNVSVRRVSDDAEIARWQEPTEGDWPFSESDLLFSPDGRSLCIRHPRSGRLTVRKLDVVEPTLCYQGEKARGGWAMDFSPDSKRLAYIMKDDRIAVVDLGSGQARHLPTAGADPEHIRFSPDGRQFAVDTTRAGKRVVELRDGSTGQVQRTFSHKKDLVSPVWHPDGHTLAATESNDLFLRLWDVESGRLLREMDTHRSAGTTCVFTRTGKQLLSNGWNPMLRLWETASGRQLLSFPAKGYAFLRVSSDDRVSAMHYADASRLQLLRLHTSIAYHTITPGDRLGWGCCGVHPNCRLLVAATEDGAIMVDLDAGREVATIPKRGVAPLLWEPSGNLLTFGFAGLLRWPVHADPRDTTSARYGPPERLLNVEVGDQWGTSADGQTLAIPNYNGGAVVLHHGLMQRTTRLQPLQPQQDVRSCAVSPNGSWVATASHGNTDGFGAKVWEAATGKLVKELRVPGLCTVTFSPDGRWLLTNSGGCRLWAVGTWAEGPTLGGSCGFFSPDGQYIAVDDTPGAIRLAETDSGVEVVRLEAPEQTRLIPCAFTPDGTRLIAVGHDTKQLHIWDLRKLRRELTALGLDWEAPPYPPASKPSTVVPPLKVTIDMGNLAQMQKADELPAEISMAIQLDPTNAHLWARRAAVYAHFGQWDKALPDCVRATELGPGNPWYWYYSSVLQLHLGDVDGYRRSCREMLQRFRSTDDVAIASGTAMTCSLSAGAVSDFDPVLKLAGLAAEKDGSYPWAIFAKGLAEYRAGHYAGAVDWQKRVPAKAAGGFRWCLTASAFAVQAMARHQLRQTEEARTALAQARSILANKMPKPEKGEHFDPYWWHDWLRAQILYREAEALIGIGNRNTQHKDTKDTKKKP